VSPLGVAEAETLVAQHLGTDPRAGHSRFVGEVMAALAAELGADAIEWMVVGLVHDLDYLAVERDWTRHGVLAAEWLGDRLPAEALAAIAAHDHRTGLRAETALADMLRLADAVAVLDQRAGRDGMIGALDHSFEDLPALAADRPFLAEIIGSIARRHRIGPGAIGAILAKLPRQPDPMTP
jgi:hypothetical protein